MRRTPEYVYQNIVTYISFCADCFILHWARMKKLFPRLLAMTLVLLSLGLAAAAVCGLLLTNDSFKPFTLAIADDSGDPALTGIISYMGEIEGMKAYTRLVRTDSGEARKMVSEGRAAAALIFPDGFLESVDMGENLSPLLLFDLSRPIETLGVTVLMESAASMLTNAQKGIYLTDAVYRFFERSEPEYDQMIWDINLKYMNWVLGRGDLFRTRLILPTGGELTISRHYLLSALVFFTFLAPAGLLYSVFSWDKDRQWHRRLRGGNKPLFAYALTQILWGAIAIFTLTALLLGGVAVVRGLLSSGGAAYPPTRLSNASNGVSSLFISLISGLAPRISPATLRAVLPGMLLSAVFFSACAFICCNCGHLVSALSLHSTIAAVFLVLSGGAVPLAFMPRGLRALSPYIPFTWTRDILAPLYTRSGAPVSSARLSFLCLAIASLLALALVKVFCVFFDKRERSGA